MIAMTMPPIARRSGIIAAMVTNVLAVPVPENEVGEGEKVQMIQIHWDRQIIPTLGL